VSFRAPPREFFYAFPRQIEFVASVGNQLLREFPGSVPTSWYRDQTNNARVGGAPESQHLLGFAFDLTTGDLTESRQIAARLREAGLVAVIESDHVHAQLFPAGFLRSLGFFWSPAGTAGP